MQKPSLLDSESINSYATVEELLVPRTYITYISSAEDRNPERSQSPQGPTIMGTGNGTPELPSAWGYSWATLSPEVISTER
jgi:hypothetical protein